MLGPRLDGASIGSTVAVRRQLVEGWWARPATGAGMVVPDGAVDLVWTKGRVPWLAGPDTRPRPVELAAGSVVVALRLAPGVAAAVIGHSVADTTDRVVPLDAVWPRTVVEYLGDELHRTGNDHRRAALAVAAAVDRVIDDEWEADAVVTGALADIRSGRPVDPGGLSERQMRRRFTDAIGYGPAIYRRIARLDRLTTLAERHPRRPLAQLAADAGYHDQAHLARDCRRLTGQPPSTLLATGVSAG